MAESDASGRFAVVGGGVAGLVVARRLAASGAAVTLFEASDRLGGTVARHEVGGLALDAGAESFAVRGGVVAALLAELGLADDIVAPAPGPAWLQPVTGEAVPLPATALLGIPADPLAPDVVRVVGRAAAQRAVELDALPVHAVPPTLGALVRERFGDDMLDRLVAPVVHGVHSQHPDDLPVARAHPGLAAAVISAGSLGAAVAQLRAAAPPGSAVAGLRGGINRIVPALAEDLARRGGDIRLSTPVADIETLDGTVVVAAPSLAAPGAPGRRIDLVTLVGSRTNWMLHPRHRTARRRRGTGRRPRAHPRDREVGVAARRRRRASRAASVVRRDPRRSRRRSARRRRGAPRRAAARGGRRRARLLMRPAAALPPAEVTVVGESVAGSGLAGLIADAERTASELLAR